MSIAVSQVARPVAYCDNDEDAQFVLQHNMQRSLLHRAPICTDVRILNREWMTDRGIDPSSVDVVMAGFPCVGFSTLGHQRGFEDDRSGLFKEVVRILNITNAPVVVLENVPQLVRAGLSHVRMTLRRKGYGIVWSTVRACDLGAPHSRARWYAIAYDTKQHGQSRVGTVMRKLASIKCESHHAWTRALSPHKRMTLTNHATRERSFALLGNAVVPHVVSRVVQNLSSFLRRNHFARHAPQPSLLPSVLAVPNGWAVGANVWSIPALTPVTHSHAHKIVLHPSAYKSRLAKVSGISSISTPVTKPMWATPVRGSPRATHRLTARAAGLLSTQLRFEITTPDHLRPGWVRVDFVEWMMGYPTGWTSLEKM